MKGVAKVNGSVVVEDRDRRISKRRQLVSSVCPKAAGVLRAVRWLGRSDPCALTPAPNPSSTSPKAGKLQSN